MTKVKLVNLVTNGSFENGTTGWSGLRSGMSVDNTTSVHGDSCLKCIGANDTYQWCQSNVFTVTRGHILYSSVMVRNNDAKTAWGLYVNNNGSQSLNLNVGQVGSTYNTFTKVSKRLTVPELEVYTINMLLYGEQSTANSSLITYWDNVLCVDLTDCFGAGNEPSQDWCDKHISWFEGSIFIEDDGYIMYNYVPDPLFLYHNNALDLYNMHQCCNSYTLTNMLTNGSFENGSVGWSLINSSGNAAAIVQDVSNSESGSHCFCFKGTDILTSSYLSRTLNGLTGGHKFYYSFDLKEVQYPTRYDLMIELVGLVNGSRNTWYSVQGNKKQNIYSRISSLVELSNTENGLYFTLGRWLSSETINSGNTYSVEVYADGWMLIDLTATFGAGNEPSKEWCDKYINYFEGSITSLPDAGMFVESIDGGTPPHSSCLRTWGSKYQNEVYFGTTKGLPYNANHKYYAAMDIYGYSNGQGYNLYWPEVSPYPDISHDTNGVLERNKPDVVAGIWQKASMILYNTSIASGKYRFRFDNDNVEVEGRTIRFTNLMLIDLTAAFGAGNEPDLAWCDKYIVLDSDGTPYIRTKDYGSEYVSNNTNHINFIMKQKTKVVRMKIQSLDHNDNIIGEIKGYCTGGSLDISNSDMVRRSIDLQFVANSKLEINKNSPFWINKRLKIFTGIDDYKGNKYWFDHGIFIPTEPETSISLSGRTISLSALDKMVLADNPVLTTTKIDVNTPIATALKGLAELYGETKLLISNYDYNLPYDYEMSAGDNIQEAMRELTNLYMNYDIYYDTNGYLVYEKQKNRINDQPVWEFVNEKDFTISRQISADYTKVYNDFMVYGYYDDTKATQPSYHLTITDSSHPFSVSNMKRKHSLVVTEDNYLTTEQCKVRAEYEKQQAENLINNFSITTAPIYSLNDVNRVIKVTDNGNVYTCLVDSISYPLDVRSSMQIDCHEIFI